MSKFCKFCGTELNELGACSNVHNANRKMCVNCSFVKITDDGYLCSNEDNMENARKKIIEAANSAAGCYSIDNINFDIKPLPLKRPTGKCTLWELNKDIVNEFIKSFE